MIMHLISSDSGKRPAQNLVNTDLPATPSLLGFGGGGWLGRVAFDVSAEFMGRP